MNSINALSPSVSFGQVPKLRNVKAGHKKINLHLRSSERYQYKKPQNNDLKVIKECIDDVDLLYEERDRFIKVLMALPFAAGVFCLATCRPILSLLNLILGFSMFKEKRENDAKYQEAKKELEDLKDEAIRREAQRQQRSHHSHRGHHS